MTETRTYLKVVGPDNCACHGGAFDYTDYLPTDDEPGRPLPERVPELCASGWHWCTPESLMREWARARMQVYEAEPSGDVTSLDDTGKCVSASGQLLRPYPLPAWWQTTMAFLDTIPDIPRFQQVLEPLPEWRVFTAPTLAAAGDAARAAARNAAGSAAGSAAWGAAWAAARNAAWAAARNAAWAAAGGAAWAAAGGAAWAAAWDAQVMACFAVCADLPIDQRHRDHVAARWEVWQRGYALVSDIDGVLYVYGVVR